MSYSGYHSMARILKLMNASLKYTWSPEFMSGTWMKNLGNTRVSDEHMRFMARCALAQGCKSINWFMFHDRDCWGDAPVSSQGHKRPSYEVLREIPEILFHRVRDWDRLRPQMDVGIVYDLIHHLHTGIGDPFICDDNNTYVGNPTIAGIPAGKASLEYYGLFRLIEQAGYQAGVIDILHNSELLHQFRVVFLPGSPITAEQTLKSLEDFVLNGGILIISGVLPQFNEKGIRVSFLGLKKAPKTKREFSIGKGKLIFIPYWIAQEKPEEEILAHITMVREIIQTFYGAPHVEIQPTYQVRWIDWKQGGGKQEYIQPRNLGSAILHSSSDEHLLFLLNHYIEAVNFNVYFGRMKVKQLIDLSTGQFFPVHNNRLNLDLDRKSASIYHVIPD